MALPPGGFIMTAFLIVGKRLIDQKIAERKQRKESVTVLTSVIAEEES
jgi:electron transport complex protein RnfE